MDPCLCHIGGFGPDEDESTTKKEVNELVGRRCIVKISGKGTKLFMKGIKNFKPEERSTDVTGIIENYQVVAAPEEAIDNELIDLGLGDTSDLLPPGTQPVPIFYIKYDNPAYDGVPGHWYIDEEVIYL